MALRLQRFPISFLNFFGLKGVSAPADLADIISPCVDVTPIYEAELLTTTTSSGAASALPITRAVTVGQQKVIAIGGAYTQGAAAGTNINISISIQVGAFRCPIASQFYPNVAAAQLIDFGVIIPKGWAVAPGTILEARVTGTAAGADHNLTWCEAFVNYPVG